MGPVGWPETVFIFFLALMLFGPKRLPELGRTVGKGLAEFQRAKSEWKAALDRETQRLAHDTANLSGLAPPYRTEFCTSDLPIPEGLPARTSDPRRSPTIS